MKPEVRAAPENFCFGARHVFLSSAGMPAEARVLKMWSQQKGLVPLLFLAFSAWFLWDGLVGYPRSDERWDAHERLSPTPGEWEKYAAERGWKTEKPEKRYGPEKYREQYWASAIMGVVGFLALAYWQRERKLVIRNDAAGITTSRGLRIPYESITRLDKTIWKQKGFAYIHYATGGRSGKLTLDDAKHDPKALDIILDETVARLSPTATVLQEKAPPATAPPAA
jgi:hypothetical protein